MFDCGVQRKIFPCYFDVQTSIFFKLVPQFDFVSAHSFNKTNSVLTITNGN